jgi:chromosome segregation ATPase
MTGEEMERAIEIILHNQANFEVQFEKTNQQIQQTDRQMEATNARVETLAKQVETVAEQMGTVVEQMGTVAEQMGIVAEQVGIVAGQVVIVAERMEAVADTQTEFIRTTIGHIEAQGEINGSVRGMLRELKETTLDLKRAQTRTDERLDRLAEIVERHISAGHNGNS